MIHFYIIPILLFVVSCGTCKPKVDNTIIQKDTVYISNTNTEYIKDSVYVYKDRFIKEKGDTVFIKEIEYKYLNKWRDKEVHDTLYVDKVDIQTVTKEVEVTKPLTFIQKLFNLLGKLFCLILIGLIIYGGYKLYRKIKL